MAPVIVSASKTQQRIIADTIFITGAPRSGTTLLGRLIGTLNGIEYQFEPPMVWTIAGLLSAKAITNEAATALLHIYLSEELLLEAVHGRRVNLRPTDDSLLLNTTSWTELLHRWHSIRNRSEALQYLDKNHLRLALKMPSIVDTIPFFNQALPNSRFIIIVRNGRDVVRSVLKKKWLTDDGLSENYWPYKESNGVKAPHLVEDCMTSPWVKMTAATRACYLWRRDAEFTLRVKEIPQLRDRLLIVKYEDLLNSAKNTLEKLSSFLSAEITDLTRLGIATIRSQQANRAQADNVFADVGEPELKRFMEMNAHWGYS